MKKPKPTCHHVTDPKISCGDCNARLLLVDPKELRLLLKIKKVADECWEHQSIVSELYDVLEAHDRWKASSE